MNQLTLLRFPLFLFIFSLCGVMVSCEAESPGATGELRVQLTDAPVDDANIEGVFVTVKQIKIDGKAVTGFNEKQTVDLLAYQNGDAYLFGTGTVTAKAYGEVTLVLDQETDADGMGPGCYVKTLDGMRHDLAYSTESTLEITTQGRFEVSENGPTDVVIDFDLRKALVYEAGSGGGNSFGFVPEDEMPVALRLVSAANTGSIRGTYTGLQVGADKVVVYAYKKGTFNKEMEMEFQGSSGQLFLNSETSAPVIDNTYTLSFLDTGEYEVCFAAYEDFMGDGEMEFTGFLQGTLMSNGDVTRVITVEAGVEASLTVQVIGLIN